MLLGDGEVSRQRGAIGGKDFGEIADGLRPGEVQRRQQGELGGAKPARTQRLIEFAGDHARGAARREAQATRGLEQGRVERHAEYVYMHLCPSVKRDAWQGARKPQDDHSLFERMDVYTSIDMRGCRG